MREAKSGFDLFLGAGLDQAVRLVVVHEWSRRWRPAVLLEAPLVLLVHVCLAPLRGYLWLTSFGLARQLTQLAPPLPSPRVRPYRPRYTIGLRVFGQDDRLLEARDAHPTDAHAAHRHLGSVLRAAHQRRLVAFEMLSDRPGHVHQAYFGGQPLMAAPYEREPGASERALTEAGLVVEATRNGMQVVQRDRRLPRAAAWVRLLLLAPVAPLCALGAGGRRWLREAWRDARGVPPRERRLALSPTALSYVVERGGVIEAEASLEARDWLAIAHAPAPHIAGGTLHRRPSVRLLSRNHQVAIDMPQAPARALSDTLLLLAQRLRAELADPSLPHAFVAAHCHRCASLIEMAVGTPCPTCGVTLPLDGP